MRRLLLLSLLAIVALPAAASAQQWTPIGKTKRDGSALFVQARSIKRGGDTVTALILTRFASPAYDPLRKDSLRALTTLATFNCKLDKVAVKQNTFFSNFDRNKVSERRTVKKPGYGPVFGAAFELARDHLCPAVKK
jgi:hypothetical protein